MASPPIDPSLLELIYDAATDPDRWREAIERLALDTGSRGGQILLWDVNGASAPFTLQVGGSSPEGDRLYAEYYGSIDPRREHALQRPVGEWMACHHVCDDRFVAASEFYQDYFIPVVGGRYMCGTRLADHQGLHAMLALARTADDRSRPYDDVTLRSLAALTPHLARAARLQLQVRRLRDEVGMRDAALDRLPVSLVVVDRDGAIRFGNAGGEAILADPTGPLTCRFGKIIARLPSEGARLTAAIRAAVDHRAGSAVSVGGVEKVQLHCVLVPLGPRSHLVESWQRPMALLLSTDPAVTTPVEPSALQSLFALTPAESRLAAALATGQSLDQFALYQGISPLTARAQLRAVFDKVGVNRQTDLVLLLQRLATRPAN